MTGTSTGYSRQCCVRWYCRLGIVLAEAYLYGRLFLVQFTAMAMAFHVWHGPVWHHLWGSGASPALLEDVFGRLCEPIFSLTTSAIHTLDPGTTRFAINTTTPHHDLKIKKNIRALLGSVVLPQSAEYLCPKLHIALTSSDDQGK